MTILNEILQTLEKANQNETTISVVFDLDSTLFCVSPRTQQILRNFPDSDLARPFQDSHTQALEKLKTIQSLPEDWGIRSALVRDEIEGRIDFFEAIREFWVLHFFSSEYLKYDEPYEGAIEFVNECEKRGADIWYLTGRDWPRMGDGTELQLRRHNLPYPEGQLSMKTNSEIYDTEYKVDFFKNFKIPLKNTWFIDNEPVILNRVHEAFPELNLVYAGTVHSGREQPPNNSKEIGFKWSY